MNKKGTTHQWWEILIIVLAIIVLVLLLFNYFGNKGLFGGVKDAAQTIWSYAPNISIGLKALNTTSVTLPGNQSGEINGLKSTIELMLASEEHDCFGNFGSLENLGEREAFQSAEATHISAIFDSSTQETLFIIGTAGGQTYKTFRIKMKPCVIAGHYNVAENFFNHFNKGETLNSPYYAVVAGIDIFYREGMIYTETDGWEASWYDGNVIRVVGFSEDMVNNQNDNFESGGMLFKGRDDEICFFPTNKVTNFDVHGIENEYVSDPDDEESLLYKWNSGENSADFKRCY
jgi:hypothetical protein